MRYRKRPIVVEAEQCIYGDIMRAKWLFEAREGGILYNGSDGVYIQTLEGDMRVDNGDYIIRGIEGELYPCKEEIFLKTYEEV